MTDLPVVGAAMTLKDLEIHRPLMLDKHRDLELQDFVYADVLNGDWQSAVDEAKRLLDGHRGRVGIHGPFWGFAVDTMDPEVRAVVRKRLLQGLDVCEALGGTHMVVHSPFTTWSYNNLDNYPNGRERLVELCHLTMKDAVKRAEEIGCELVIENIEDKDPYDRIRLANGFGSDAVAVSIDTGHAHYAHGSTGAPPVDYYVKAAGNRLRHVHLQDADGYADRHWTLGQGTVNWPAVFEALNNLTSEPRLIVELRDAAGIPASIAHLESLGLAQ
ncbi:sugar phosphate isomerase/epimerase family protein [Roseibium aggregatum]|uniref:Sugar phosphate isomerase/epimerase n=1 Tax=Roseibium aggregatum TaxID=187304 RepID=A0A926P099_9HYPH|nr:sugar phosphate isomerase/epimerase family protein [Roseibium aggregatum]MBD1547395.1 sugar phosphate isomerase/epimerase [Roseibium aggregatum]